MSGVLTTWSFFLLHLLCTQALHEGVGLIEMEGELLAHHLRHGANLHQLS